MPLTNIVDDRDNNLDIYVYYVTEPSYFDNSAPGATQFDPVKFESYDGVGTVAEAVSFVEKLTPPTTLYLYTDRGRSQLI